MSLELAIRLTEILLALVFIQQSLEHLYATPRERPIFIIRILVCVLLLLDIFSPWNCYLLLAINIALLHRYQGPYNGGSDRMGLLILCCLCLTHATNSPIIKEIAFGYLAIQLVLSYVIAGWVKILNPDWRNGQALRDVFTFSAYPASESLHQWADRPQFLWIASWSVIMLELLVPFALLTPATLAVGLIFAAGFHFGNAYFFGLNRFFWTWLAAYPSIIWLQERVF